MAETKEFRTIMYSVVNGNVVIHRLPFNVNEPIGRLKLEQFIKRGFTFDDPRNKADTGISLPQVIVTQEVDFEKPIDGILASLIADDVSLTDGDSPVTEVEVARTSPQEVKTLLSQVLTPKAQPEAVSQKKVTRGRPRKTKKGVGNA